MTRHLTILLTLTVTVLFFVGLSVSVANFSWVCRLVWLIFRGTIY